LPGSQDEGSAIIPLTHRNRKFCKEEYGIKDYYKNKCTYALRKKRGEVRAF
jgi:hypothetical protein